MPPRKKAITPPTEPTPEIVENVAPIEAAPQKKVKRERKSTKHGVVAVVTADGIQGNFQSEMKRPLIVHLPIASQDVQFHDPIMNYDPTPPCQPVAYDVSISDPFSAEAAYTNTQSAEEDDKSVLDVTNESVNNSNHILASADSVESKNPVVVSPTPAVIPKRKEYGPSQLLIQNAQTKITKQLPESTDAMCFWCCESFEGRPCVIPAGIVDNVWQVYGNFCNPSCALAYLISELLDTHVRWERIALLNRLYGASCGGRVYPAPNRETLKRFGGTFTIEEFREICDRQRIRVDIHMPPMVSILASMDTKPIDFYETPLRNTFSNPIPSIMPSAEETGVLKLKRNKPLKDSHSTLDNVLQISIKAR